VVHRIKKYVDLVNSQAVSKRGGHCIHFGNIIALNEHYFEFTKYLPYRSIKRFSPMVATSIKTARYSALAVGATPGCKMKWSLNRDQFNFGRNLKDDSSINTGTGAISHVAISHPNGQQAVC